MNYSNELYKLIGKNFKNIRKNIIKKSQEQLAEEIYMSRSFISQLESSKVDIGVSIDTLFYIARKYNFDIRLYFDGYEELIENLKNNEKEKIHN